MNVVGFIGFIIRTYFLTLKFCVYLKGIYKHYNPVCSFMYFQEQKQKRATVYCLEYKLESLAEGL